MTGSLPRGLRRLRPGGTGGTAGGFDRRLLAPMMLGAVPTANAWDVFIGFRPGHPETKSSPLFGALPDGAFTDSDPGAAIHPGVEPLPGECVVTKKRVSAFAGSDLDLVLHGADADPEVHRVLTEKVFPRQADVTTSTPGSPA
ncbi:cysteine hydrolase family protein [Streptomyces sp. NPDC050421]|uniref:cysteine hydrolase family protein n=1 Tax=unclassified Streptomyces TaxID=2593676 RepID=UPI00379F9EAA